MLSQSIDKLFFDEFKIHLATTPAQKDEVYKVRYKVYCEEFQYEAANQYPNRMENDSYDHQSVHFLVEHRKSGASAGCLRLIFPTPKAPDLPFQKFYDLQLLHNNVDLNDTSFYTRCEVSRLAVTSEFRKCTGNFLNSSNSMKNVFEFQKNDRRGFPLVPLSLYLAGCAFLAEAGIKSVFTMMEPRLSRRLRHVGFHFHQIGRLVPYHGQRAPFYISLHELMRDLDPKYFALRERINEEIKLDCKAYTAILSQKAAY